MSNYDFIAQNRLILVHKDLYWEDAFFIYTFL